MVPYKNLVLFPRWAAERLQEYLIRGFVPDDEMPGENKKPVRTVSMNFPMDQDIRASGR